MRDAIIQKVKSRPRAEDRLNLLREELHHLLLQEMDRKQGFEHLCFVGGTALRILFGLDRFSEDLDFSAAPKGKTFELGPLANAIQKSMEAFGFDCQVRRVKIVKTVQSCWVAFGQLLHHIDSSFRDNQKLLIKLEVDTNPPRGAREKISPVTAGRLYKVRHYDLSSLFAGKLHAVLFRQYTKGRDLYDFLWYTGKNVPVNKILLENAIAQTQKQKIHLNAEVLKNLLKEKFEATNFEAAKKDVAPFLLDSHSLNLFQKSIFLDAVAKVDLAYQQGSGVL